MKLLDSDNINNYLSSRDLRITINSNSRWIDQKCTPDVLSIVSDCILNIDPSLFEKGFTSYDVWLSQYSIINIQTIFKKPSPSSEAAKNEYDKFFQQPLELLAFAGVLSKTKSGRKNLYKVKNIDLIELIALSERLSLNFLIKYITKVLKDSKIIHYFEIFFEKQESSSYLSLKTEFTKFLKENTNIKNNNECWRIFTKVLNPLAFFRNSKGTERGRISNDKITYDMLMYNRENFRDANINKPKSIARKSHKIERNSKEFKKYLDAKAIKFVKYYNDNYNNGLSELRENDKSLAVEVHHIFPKNTYPEISHLIENLICITPNEHRISAHPKSNFIYVDREFQKKCLIAKLNTIYESSRSQESYYDLSNFIKVLSIGLSEPKALELNQNNIEEIRLFINSSAFFKI